MGGNDWTGEPNLKGTGISRSVMFSEATVAILAVVRGARFRSLLSQAHHTGVLFV